MYVDLDRTPPQPPVGAWSHGVDDRAYRQTSAMTHRRQVAEELPSKLPLRQGELNQPISPVMLLEEPAGLNDLFKLGLGDG